MNGGREIDEIAEEGIEMAKTVSCKFLDAKWMDMEGQRRLVRAPSAVSSQTSVSRESGLCHTLGHHTPEALIWEVRQ